MNGLANDTPLLINQLIHEVTTSPNWDEVIEVINDCKYGNPIGESDEDRAKHVTDLLKMDYVGCGSERIVMTSKKSALTPFVVKMPLDYTGFEDNDEEAALWNNAIDDIRHDIVPLYAWEDEFIISKRIEPFDDEKGKLFKDKIYVVYKRLRANGLIPIDIAPHRYDQWGLLDGRVVAVDTARCILQDKAKRTIVTNNK
mgnify:CR=1 FL=1